MLNFVPRRLPIPWDINEGEFTLKFQILNQNILGFFVQELNVPNSTPVLHFTPPLLIWHALFSISPLLFVIYSSHMSVISPLTWIHLSLTRLCPTPTSLCQFSPSILYEDEPKPKTSSIHSLHGYCPTHCSSSTLMFTWFQHPQFLMSRSWGVTLALEVMNIRSSIIFDKNFWVLYHIDWLWQISLIHLREAGSVNGEKEICWKGVERKWIKWEACGVWSTRLWHIFSRLKWWNSIEVSAQRVSEFLL